MESTTITISNPTPYNKVTKELNEFTGKMETIIKTTTRFIVTGTPDAVELYYADQTAELAKQGKKPGQRTDEGHPMKFFDVATGAKYGEEAVLTRSVLEDGTAIWFMAEDNSKILKQMINSLSPLAQRSYADREVENIIALSKTYAKNIAVNRVNYANKLNNAPKTEATNLDKF